MIEIKQEWIDAGARALDSAGIRVNVYGMAQSESDAAAAVLEAVAPMIEAAVDSRWYSTMLDDATSVQITVRKEAAAEIAKMNDAECDLAKDVQRELEFRVQLGVIDDVLDVALPLVAKQLTGDEAGKAT